jgi:hypothetical protein
MESRGDSVVFKTIGNKACLACSLWQNDPKHLGALGNKHMHIRELCINWEGYSATWKHIRIGPGSSGKNDCAAQQISVSDAGAFLL